VTTVPNGSWFTSLPPCETLVPCGQDRHVIRWEAGELRLPNHSDPEAELVLAALGGEKARCVEIAAAWGRHVADLTVLGIGPRSAADPVEVSWDDVDAAGQAGQGIWAGATPRGRAMKLASAPAAAVARAAVRLQVYQQEAGQASQRRLDMLSLLALGTGFQVRLIGQVVAAHADRPDEPDEHGHSIRPALTAALADLLRRQVAQEVIAHGKQAGIVPAGLLRWAEEVLTPTVDWRAVLAAELRRAVAEVSGAVDYSYRRPSRRSAVAGPVVLPALRRPVPEVAVVCDTSGSMTDDLLAMVLAEVEGLLRALGLARQVRVLACDTAVAPVQRVSSARQVQLIGGGGTDMGAGIDAAAALRPRPAVTVVLTDGYTPWPERAPKGMRVVVGLIGDQAPDAPPWTRSVRVEP
jgi:VWA-like protein DUF2201/putative metallopeptidase-like protein